MSVRAALAAGLACSALAAVPAPAFAGPTEDFTFSTNYHGSPAGVPPLTPLGPGTNHFVREDVDGAGRRYVLDFPRGNGVTAQTVANDVVFVPSTTYTIVVLARLNDDSPTCWARYVDLQGGTSDTGLYRCSGGDTGFLTFFNYQPEGADPIDIGWHQIVLTRSNGKVAGYVDGVFQWRFDDTENQWGVITPENILRFFRDNDTGCACGEEASGAVSRIRLYRGALSPKQVKYLNRTKQAMTLSPTAGPAGTPVHVVGTGYGPGDTVGVSFVDAPTHTTTALGSATADAVGSWTADVTVPAGATAGAADKIVGKGVIDPISVSKVFTVGS